MPDNQSSSVPPEPAVDASQDRTGGTQPTASSERSDSPSLETAPKAARALKKLTDANPESLFQMMAVTGAGMMNPLHSKMDAEHITKVLDLAEQHDNREFQLAQKKESNATDERKSIRQYVFWALVVILIFVSGVMLLFREHSEILLPVISGLSGLGAGFLAGLGVGKIQGK